MQQHMKNNMMKISSHHDDMSQEMINERGRGNESSSRGKRSTGDREQQRTKRATTTTLLLLVSLVLQQQQQCSAADTKVRRLRRNNAVVVPDLSPAKAKDPSAPVAVEEGFSSILKDNNMKNKVSKNKKISKSSDETKVKTATETATATASAPASSKETLLETTTPSTSKSTSLSSATVSRKASEIPSEISLSEAEAKAEQLQLQKLFHADLSDFHFESVLRMDAFSMSFPFDDVFFSYDPVDRYDGGNGGGNGGGGGSGGGGSQNLRPPTMSREEMIVTKCNMSPATRSTDLEMLLHDSRGSGDAQRRAIQWIDDVDGAVLCPNNPDRVRQRYYVALIYYQLGGQNWNTCRAVEDGGRCDYVPFLDDSHECLWYGIGCEGAPRYTTTSNLTSAYVDVDNYYPVVNVEIKDNNLSGPLFNELFSLTELRTLLMDGNKGITGTISERIGQLQQLEALDLDDNDLVGTLPQNLYSLRNLRALDINNNELTGTISNSIGDLTELVVVQLDNNRFTGSYPVDGLLQLEKLAIWTALNNEMTGSLEPVCDVVPERRVTNDFIGYLQFFWVDCFTTVECSCCECMEPRNQIIG